MRANVTLAEVVRAQVALLFGKYRPAGGLTPEEQTAIRSERVEFGDRLVALIRGIDAPDSAIIEQVRLVTRDVYADERMRNLPTVESLCALVKRSFATKVRAACLGCAEMGGIYENASPDTPIRARQPGDFQYERVGWLCLGHHHAVSWYENREHYRRGIPSIADTMPRFEYPPPGELLPRAGQVGRAPADDPKWESWTDGANMGPLARWAREFCRKVYGHEVGSTETPLLANQGPPERARSEAWRDL